MQRVDFIIIVMFSLLPILLSGCIKEDNSSCGNRVQFEIRAVWPDHVQKPEGIRTVIYPAEGKSYVVDNFPPEGGILSINRGTYSFLIHNNDNTKIALRNIRRIETYEAYTQKVDVGSYKPVAPDEDIVDQPDALWVTSVDRHDIFQSHIVTVYPQQIVKRYIFKLLSVEGLENIRAVRGTLTGMMGTYFINPAVQPVKTYSLYFDKATIKDGITFDILSFGVVEQLSNNGVPNRYKHMLTVEFMNKSEIRRYSFDVTGLLNAIRDGGEIDIRNEIEIPPGEDPDDGGFDAEIGDWDNVIVPLE